MVFDFVLMALLSKEVPLSSKKINDRAREYKFAPLLESGAIYSVDAELWGLKEGEAKNFCPSESDVEIWLKHSIKSNLFFVVALCDHEDFEPPGSTGVKIKLAPWKEVVKKYSTNGLLKIGFDVVDSWTGISAINNIGYSKSDLIQINRLKLKANEYGLLNSISDAMNFAQLACTIATEHAPYEVVEIHARLPS